LKVGAECQLTRQSVAIFVTKEKNMKAPEGLAARENTLRFGLKTLPFQQ